tara:strand:- start:47 stop:385 length:339 start_codon:yes stop_codon:yes gene_type:complete
MNDIPALVKSATSTLVSLGVLLGILSAVIVAFGGKIPPWPTRDEVTQIVNIGVGAVFTRMDADKCADYNSRSLRTQAQLKRDANDVAALQSFTEFNNILDMIPHCVKAALPR